MAPSLLLALIAAGPSPLVDDLDVVWTSPSADSAGSMPLGNGEVGINLWVEPSGDVVFYLARTDAWGHNTRLLKLGRVRLRLEPSPLVADAPFLQRLHLAQGKIRLRLGAAWVTARVDAHAPTVHLTVDSPTPVSPTIDLEVWRTARREITGRERFSAYGFADSPDPVYEEPDTIVERPAALVWFHRNETSTWPAILEHQGLGSLTAALDDPLLHRTFGGWIDGAGLRIASPTRLVAAEPRQRWELRVVTHTAQTDTADEYLAELAERAATIVASEPAHDAWWQEFWNRSHLRVTADRLPDTPDGRRLTTNDLPLRIGGDSDGQNQFQGTMRRVRVWSRALAPAEVGTEPAGDPALIGDWDLTSAANGTVANRARGDLPARAVGRVRFGPDGARFSGEGYLEVNDDPALDLAEALTIEAWIRPEVIGPGGARLVDKSRAGTADGYLLDTWPGLSLRFIGRPNTLRCEANLTPGEWVHVAATHDAATGTQRLFVAGREVAAWGGEPGGARTVGEVLTQGYALQRFITACAGRGGYPIKFNGSLFTVDATEDGERLDADYRRWGAPFWFQNTRLPYWSMLAAGDEDSLRPLFRMFRDALPLATERTRLYFGHDGAYFPETMYFFGAYANDNYGWNRAGKHPSHIDNTYIRYYYDGALELCVLGLEAFRAFGDRDFLDELVLPTARAVIAFYDEHYPRRDGRLRIEPSQALETWQQAADPLPPIAGLTALLDRLIALDRLAPGERAAWRRLRAELPPLPTATVDGENRLLPAAEVFSDAGNIENPELYAVFPYRLVAVGRGNEALGRATFAARRIKRSQGWMQDAIQAAWLGLAEQAAADCYGNFATHHAGSRFPAFWGPNFDWIPDQDHGSVAMIALQSMVLQWDEESLHVLPAWPAGWDVSAKLHAPGGPVEIDVRDGALRRLVINGDVVRDPRPGPYPPGGSTTPPRRGAR